VEVVEGCPGDSTSQTDSKPNAKTKCPLCKEARARAVAWAKDFQKKK
jgi:hypothetical protein